MPWLSDRSVQSLLDADVQVRKELQRPGCKGGEDSHPRRRLRQPRRENRRRMRQPGRGNSPSAINQKAATPATPLQRAVTRNQPCLLKSILMRPRKLSTCQLAALAPAVPRLIQNHAAARLRSKRRPRLSTYPRLPTSTTLCSD